MSSLTVVQNSPLVTQGVPQSIRLVVLWGNTGTVTLATVILSEGVEKDGEKVLTGE